jgi:hypothetical protein
VGDIKGAADLDAVVFTNEGTKEFAMDYSVPVAGSASRPVLSKDAATLRRRALPSRCVTRRCISFARGLWYEFLILRRSVEGIIFSLRGL